MDISNIQNPMNSSKIINLSATLLLIGISNCIYIIIRMEIRGQTCKRNGTLGKLMASIKGKSFSIQEFLRYF